MKISVLFFCVLFAFWLIITESLHFDNLMVGAAVSFIVVSFNKDIVVIPQLSFKHAKFIFIHAWQMIIEVLKANIQVVKIVLSPKMDFQQGLVIFTPKLKYDWNEVLFANSISLTPGTLTINVEKDIYTVHILDIINAESLVGWKILDNLRKMEEANDN